jgi:hydrogenase-4 component E
MSTTTYIGVLELASGAVLVCAVMTLWRRSVRAIVTMLRLQGISLAVVAGVLAAHQHDAGLAVTAFLVLAVKGFIVPGLLRRVVREDPRSRETAPLVNVPASLVFAAVLIVLSYVVSANITALAPSAATRLVPIGIATVLVGYFMLVTRRRAVSQIVGLLLVDLGAALDVLLVVVVLQVLVVNIRNEVGSSELDQLKELHD